MSKIIPNSPILRNNHELNSIVVNKGQMYGELRYFRGIYSNSIKSKKQLRREIRDFDIFRKITERRIHRIQNPRIWIKICGEINEQQLGRKSKHEERENQN